LTCFTAIDIHEVALILLDHGLSVIVRIEMTRWTTGKPISPSCDFGALTTVQYFRNYNYAVSTYQLPRTLSLITKTANRGPR
jgi:hypothetical protein